MMKEHTKGQEFIPYEYQKKAIKEMIANPNFGLWMGIGFGKTVTSLNVAYHFKQPTLVIVPLAILYSTWLTEHRKWTFSQTLKISVLHGPDKEQNFLKKAGIYLINPEGVPWLLSMVQKHKRFPWKILIVDESPKFKNPKSKRWKALVKMIGSFERRYLLSGNPTPNRFSDIWAQVFLLDKGKALEKSYYKFRNKYFYPTDYMQFNWELKPGAKDEIISRIGSISIMLTIDDIGELRLPDRIIVDRYYDLPDKIRKIYNEMEKKLFLSLDELSIEEINELSEDENPKKILASNKAVALGKCWQIAQGFVYETIKAEDEDEKDIRLTHDLHSVNLDLLKEIVEEQSGSPTMIVYNFGEDRERLKATFPEAPILGSPTKSEMTGKIVNQWNNNEHEVVLAHPKRIAHGANMQLGDGHTIIFYSQIYNADDYDQVIKRLERQGSKHANVVVIRLIARRTIHEAMIESVQSKDSMAKDFLNSIKKYRESLNSEE